MTNEESILWLVSIAEHEGEQLRICAEDAKALQMGIDAIKALEQQPCEDCISRKDTIEWLKKVTITDGITFKTGFEQILYDIEQMPSVRPKAESEDEDEGIIPDGNRAS